MSQIMRQKVYPFLDLTPCLWIGKDCSFTLDSSSRIKRLLDYSGNGLPVVGQGSNPILKKKEDDSIEIHCTSKDYLLMNHNIINSIGYILIVKGTVIESASSIMEIETDKQVIHVPVQEDGCSTIEIDDEFIKSIKIKPNQGIYAYHFVGLFPQFYKNWK